MFNKNLIIIIFILFFSLWFCKNWLKKTEKEKKIDDNDNDEDEL